eukprot:3860760-Rhodomonas_salina.1
MGPGARRTLGGLLVHAAEQRRLSHVRTQRAALKNPHPDPLLAAASVAPSALASHFPARLLATGSTHGGGLDTLRALLPVVHDHQVAHRHCGLGYGGRRRDRLPHPAQLLRLAERPTRENHHPQAGRHLRTDCNVPLLCFTPPRSCPEGAAIGWLLTKVRFGDVSGSPTKLSWQYESVRAAECKHSSDSTPRLAPEPRGTGESVNHALVVCEWKQRHAWLWRGLVFIQHRMSLKYALLVR